MHDDAAHPARQSADLRFFRLRLLVKTLWHATGGRFPARPRRADPRLLHAYLIVGHPNSDEQAVEGAMTFAHRLGIRIMLSKFSPIPGTPDGEECRRWIDLGEPLRHNKTAFVVNRLGALEINRLKILAGQLNESIEEPGQSACAETHRPEAI